MQVIVVGGGIGGVAATIALRKEGHDVILLEQAPALTEVGGGLIVAPNAKKALNHLGCGERVAASGVATEETVFYDMEGGDRIFVTRMGAVSAQTYGEYQYSMHRADLLDALLTQLPMEHVRLGARVVSLSETADKATVELESGERLSADLVVGADGIRSRVRASLFGESEPQFTGLLGWRALIPVERAPHVAPLARNFLWMGPNRHVGFYPVRPGKLFNLFAWIPAEEVVRESWNMSGDVADLRKSLEGASRELTSIVDCIDQAFITPLYIRDPLPRWSTDRITLLGDAAHPATAAAGQGAAMALEDAVTLGICLRGCTSPTRLRQALEEYQARRTVRTSRMQAISLTNLRWMNESDPVQRGARNGRFRGLNRLDPIGTTPWRWLFSHDPVRAAEAPIDKALAAIEQVVNDRKRPAARRASDAWAAAILPAHRTRLWRGEREGYEEFLDRLAPVPAGTPVETVDADGVPCLIVGAGTGPTIVHLHGGGFTFGSAKSAVPVAARLARAVGGRVLLPDYRLAPEHGAPAAGDDVATAYRWLLRQPWRGPSVIVTGEDAGGSLALSLAIALRDARDTLPSSIHLVSPFLDLRVSGASVGSASLRDPWGSRERLVMSSASYIQDRRPDDPSISPCLSDLAGLPTLRVYAASDEALVDDARALARAARDAGVDVDLTEVDDSVHSFILFPDLPESDMVGEAIRLMVKETTR